MSLFGMTKNHKSYKVIYSKIDIWQDHSYVFSVDNFFLTFERIVTVNIISRFNESHMDANNIIIMDLIQQQPI